METTSKYTKKQRRNFYLLVANLIENNMDGFNYVCHLLAKISTDDAMQTNINPNDFPEFFLFDDFRYDHCAWLTGHNIWDLPYNSSYYLISEYKLNVLYLCIEMCK